MDKDHLQRLEESRCRETESDLDNSLEMDFPEYQRTRVDNATRHERRFIEILSTELDITDSMGESGKYVILNATEARRMLAWFRFYLEDLYLSYGLEIEPEGDVPEDRTQ